MGMPFVTSQRGDIKSFHGKRNENLDNLCIA